MAGASLDLPPGGWSYFRQRTRSIHVNENAPEGAFVLVRHLVVQAARSRYIPDGASDHFLFHALREVADGDDADQPLVAIDHGKPAHLLLRHVARDFLDVEV